MEKVEAPNAKESNPGVNVGAGRLRKADLASSAKPPNTSRLGGADSAAVQAKESVPTADLQQGTRTEEGHLTAGTSVPAAADSAVFPAAAPRKATSTQEGSAKPDKGAAVQILIKGGRELNKRLWMTDPVYRIVRALPRSDVVHFSKCKLKEKDCVRAVHYIEEAADAPDDRKAHGLGGMKELRLQWAATMHGGLQHALPLLFSHRYTLRKVDLSRNAITSKDIDSLANALDLGCAHNAHPNLELLDLSYNPNLGDAGAIAILTAIAPNKVIKALQLVHCGITDESCSMIMTLLLCRPAPVLLDPTTAERTFGGAVSVAEADKFFLNLNSNRIGSRGLMALTSRVTLPSFISISVVKQVILPTAKSNVRGVVLPSALLDPSDARQEEEQDEDEK